MIFWPNASPTLLQKLVLTGKEFGFDIFPLITDTVLDWVSILPSSQGRLLLFFGSILSESEREKISFLAIYALGQLIRG